MYGYTHGDDEINQGKPTNKEELTLIWELYMNSYAYGNHKAEMFAVYHPDREKKKIEPMKFAIFAEGYLTAKEIINGL